MSHNSCYIVVAFIQQTTYADKRHIFEIIYYHNKTCKSRRWYITAESTKMKRHRKLANSFNTTYFL